MEWLLGAVLAVVAGAAVGVAVGVALGWWLHARRTRGVAVSGPTEVSDSGSTRRDVPGEGRDGDGRATALDEVPGAGIADVLAVLGDVSIVVESGDDVIMHSPSAKALGLVRDSHLVHASMREVVRAVRRERVIRELELEVPRSPLGEGTLSLDVRVAPLGSSHVLLLVEDRTRARHVEDVRRDFVANVSHELKTPVGGISLLAEAIADAADDPEAVARFAGRIGAESRRLATLVQEIVALSQLQSQDSSEQVGLVDLGPVVREAVGRTATLAERSGITVVVAVEPGVHVYGDAGQLATALANLLSNAINYSPAHTRVAVSVRVRGFVVELIVTDQGSGIPEADLPRIFERFYRVDAARSRATGGTGLGLAIVKHICANHGGEVVVWSAVGSGSTFTMRLPAAVHGPLGGHDDAAQDRSAPPSQLPSPSQPQSPSHAVGPAVPVQPPAAQPPTTHLTVATRRRRAAAIPSASSLHER